MTETISPPTPSLGPKGLTIGIVLLTLIPLSFVVWLYFTLPPGRDPVLDAHVAIGPRPWTSGGTAQTRMVPSVILKNPTQGQWRNVNLSINGQYDYYYPDAIQAGQEMVIPLKFFHTKGNQFYSIDDQPLNSLTIYAQVPSGARAILKIPGDQLSFSKY